MSPVRVDFYLINDEQPQAVLNIACRLLEKAYKQGLTVFVWCATEAEAMMLDQLLWVYKPEQFIPHALVTEQRPSPIQIGISPPADWPAELILNVTPTAVELTLHQAAKRIIEIVPTDPAAKSISRDHYRIYRMAGCLLHTHQI